MQIAPITPGGSGWPRWHPENSNESRGEGTMQLYTHPMSSSARRVTLVAAHLGIELETRTIDLGNQSDRAALAAVNPNVKIPVLVTDELTLWEGHAIAQLLCERAGARGAELYPTELTARADVTRWLFWVSAHLAPAVGPITFEKLWKKLVEGPNAAPDPALVARYERFLHQAIGVLDRHLADRTWVVGKTLTLADYSIAATLMYRRQTQLPLDAYRHVLALLARVEDTAAWKATEPQRWG
jgi:glutathione S-transferase